MRKVKEVCVLNDTDITDFSNLKRFVQFFNDVLDKVPEEQKDKAVIWWDPEKDGCGVSVFYPLLSSEEQIRMNKIKELKESILDKKDFLNPQNNILAGLVVKL